MDKELIKARIKMKWKAFINNTVALMFSILGLIVLCVGLMCFSWYIGVGGGQEGIDRVVRIMTGKMAQLWYVLGLVAFVATLSVLSIMKNKKGGK